jgi:ferrochelatase
MKTGILLINLGTPDSPSTGDVRKYLREFLSDPEVIDINPTGRWLLVNLIIAPFRAPKSAKLYSEIWTKEGSPLLLYGIELKNKVQQALGESFVVELGMRYQSPSLESAFQKLIASGVDRIVALPLYPQYASSTTGSTIAAIHETCTKLHWDKSKLHIIERFHHLDSYKQALIKTAANYDHKNYDHVIFSFHGVPQRHITKTDQKLGSGQCKFGSCCETINEGNKYCYRANCIVTANDLAAALAIPKEKYTISFQSRLGRDPWVQPYSDQTIIELGKSGKKKLLVFSPAFVADCLETIHEIGVEYDELFQEHGGEKVTLVPSLNAEDFWVDAVVTIVNS